MHRHTYMYKYMHPCHRRISTYPYTHSLLLPAHAHSFIPKLAAKPCGANIYVRKACRVIICIHVQHVCTCVIFIGLWKAYFLWHGLASICMYIYIYIYAMCLHVCIHIHTCIHMYMYKYMAHACIHLQYAHVCARPNVCMCACVKMWKDTRTCDKREPVFVCMNECMSVCM